MKKQIHISKFEVIGLFGEKDVSITFDSNIKILVGENGTGKTTVLNLLYYLLSNNIYKLKRLPFEQLFLHFSSKQTVNIKKSDLSKGYFGGFTKHPFFKKGIPKGAINDLVEQYRMLGPDDFKKSGVFRFFQRQMEVPSSLIVHLAEDFAAGADMDMINKPVPIKKEIEKIKKNFNFVIKYFPTYRRIEEDLRSLGYGHEELLNEETVIQFGMTDVEELKNKITKEIKDISLIWLAKTNGKMLDQLVEGFKVDKTMQNSLKDNERLKVVLDRIGNNIKDSNKNTILNWANDGVINKPDHKPLVYFLSNLILAYEKQKESDNAIKEFTEISNKYLVDKKVIYDESAVDIKIIRTKNDKEVEMEKLSSGEKQIISLFSKLYLDKSKDIAIFFDEPELSLSIEWQSQLLPDIINSKRCAFLFATTHSPFIFDNELKRYTSDLSNFIKEREV